MTTSTGRCPPLEIPGVIGPPLTFRTPTATVLVLPAEVYTTGLLLRVRAQLSELPEELAASPGSVLVAVPGRERTALTLWTAGEQSAGGRAVASAGGRSDGPRRWDVEFWLSRVAFGEAPPRLRWPIVGVDVELSKLTTERLAAAADTARPVT